MAILLGAVLAILPLPTATPVARAIGAGVAIDSTGFHPDDMQILVGQAVLWTNFDSVAHTVTSAWPGAKPTPTPTPVMPASLAPTPTPTPLFDLTLGPGESDSVTFSEPGLFEYYCREHPDEIGKIYVAAEPLPTPSPSPGLPNAAYVPGRMPPGMPLIVLGIALMTIGTLLALAWERDETPGDEGQAR
jgi:plastocyanin